MTNTMQLNVQQLCSVRSWAGIVRVQEMLGGTFNRALHTSEQVVQTNAPPTAKAPVGSPFVEGGVVVVEAQTGMGKVELAEHIVIYAAVKLLPLPVFGSMGPR